MEEKARKRTSRQIQRRNVIKEKYHPDLNTKVFIQDLTQEVPKPQFTADRKLHLENNYCTFAFFPMFFFEAFFVLLGTE